MADAVLIRDALVGDAERIAELLEGGSLHPGAEDPKDREPYEEALAEILGDPGPSTVLVAEVDGLVIGTCQLLVLRHLQRRGGRCLEIESMHVDAAWRNRGIGAMLLEAATERGTALGCYRVQLTSNVERTDAHRFYETNGFVASHLGFKWAAPSS